ncbi:MAG TPA: alpha/beta fold hydrolase, partial [bacterium]|nr:alpha/beta fold hydrolase [bacterium]
EVSADTQQHTFVVRYQSDSLTITGLLGLPVNQSPRATSELRPWPGIVIAHGYYDPAHYYRGQGTKSTVEGLARRGYVVFMPDYRGYAESQNSQNPFTPGYEDDVINAVLALRALPYVDDERVGLVGYSWGGGLAVKAAMALGGRVRCFVDYYGQLGGVTPGRSELQLYVYAGATTQEEALALFKERSPLFHAEQMACPVLMIHGDNDQVVKIEQSQALLRTLQAANRTAELLTIPGAAHAFGDDYENPGKERMLQFLDQHLQDRDWSDKWQKLGRTWPTTP